MGCALQKENLDLPVFLWSKLQLLHAVAVGRESRLVPCPRGSSELPNQDGDSASSLFRVWMRFSLAKTSVKKIKACCDLEKLVFKYAAERSEMFTFGFNPLLLHGV